MRLYAWAHALTPLEAIAGAEKFPGLGLVLNAGNMAAADRLAVPPIIYITTVEQAHKVAALKAPILGVVVNDERNADGPSGKYMKPEEYARQYAAIKEILPDAWTMALQPVGGFWRELFRARLYDHAYPLPYSPVRGFNPNKVRLSEVKRVLDEPGPWLLSPAPFRPWWDRLWQPVSVKQWAAVARDPRVVAVAFWCLREYKGQPEHGLLDINGNLTNVGREVLAEIPAPNPRSFVLSS